MTNTTNKCYSDLIKIDSYEGRFDYLKLKGRVGEETFSYHRYLNQQLYKSLRWKEIRDKVIIRDNGCDMGDLDNPINGRIIVHHINPLTKIDILELTSKVFDMDNLISVSHITHEAIHYGNFDIIPKDYEPRKPNDTCPWR